MFQISDLSLQQKSIPISQFISVSILTSSHVWHVCYQCISIQTLYYLIFKPLFTFRLFFSLLLILPFRFFFHTDFFVRTSSPSYFGSRRKGSWTKRTSRTVFTVFVRDRVSLLPKLSRVLCFSIVSNRVKYRPIGYQKKRRFYENVDFDYGFLSRFQGVSLRFINLYTNISSNPQQRHDF